MSGSAKRTMVGEKPVKVVNGKKSSGGDGKKFLKKEIIRAGKIAGAGMLAHHIPLAGPLLAIHGAHQRQKRMMKSQKQKQKLKQLKERERAREKVKSKQKAPPPKPPRHRKPKAETPPPKPPRKKKEKQSQPYY